MKELLSRWNELRAELNGKHLLLLLDFDGTLSRLRNHPDKAVLSAKAAQQLRQLALSPDVTLGFISGRDLASLRSKLKIKQAIYAGGHGCHIQ
ncbi:MAG TPA: trehalose-phosphatase, partial [Elusimicrobiales bacterium]|nr:trehalose-phosphatase [Elusimicrobiales bacterium]